MKTAISVPDDAYERIRHAAETAGMNRSEFFTKAALKLAEELDEDRWVAEYNRALELSGPSDTEDFLRAAAARTGERTAW